ncbi:MAG: hypothetical protein ABIP17_07285 [Ilumatobacteraceae bacterium]
MASLIHLLGGTGRRWVNLRTRGWGIRLRADSGIDPSPIGRATDPRRSPLNDEIIELDDHLTTTTAPSMVALNGAGTQTAAALLVAAGGNPHANAALYTIVICRLRWDPATEASMHRRLAEGRTRKEVIRCLETYVPDRPTEPSPPTSPHPAPRTWNIQNLPLDIQSIGLTQGRAIAP